MNRRHAHAFAQPTLTGGDDRVRPACNADPNVIGALIDTPRSDYLARAAAATCRTCPLAATCLTSKADPNWAKAAKSILTVLAGGSVRAKRRTVAECGSESGYARHVRTLKEPACDACKAAKAAAGAERLKKRQEAAA